MRKENRGQEGGEERKQMKEGIKIKNNKEARERRKAMMHRRAIRKKNRDKDI